MKRLFRATLSVFIIVSMLFNSVIYPAAIDTNDQTAQTLNAEKLALIQTQAERLNSPDVNNALNGYKLDSANIVGERTDKREKFVRHFRMDDGTFQAVVYNAAVNYQKEDGSWSEVDNTLQQSADKNGNTVFATKDNGYMSVAFANNSKNNKLVSITKGAFSLSWMISGISSGKTETFGSNMALSDISPSVIDDLTAKKAELSGNALKRLADKVTSHIKYAGVAENVDVDYFIEPERVKENITLASYVPDFSISFDITAEGLTAKTMEGGITAFCSEDKEAFFLMPSSIFDASNNEGNVKTSLEPISGGYRLTLAPDDTWLKSAIYPVVLDPQIQVDWSASNINDTYISSKYPNGVNNDGTNGP